MDAKPEGFCRTNVKPELVLSYQCKTSKSSVKQDRTDPSSALTNHDNNRRNSHGIIL